ncbi:AHH domain-containing protein [Sessilibacter corallicola]|uniref:Bacteriophage Mx8 p63 C-terminal domain-containing protein n=1 Tax=Sessilibacter corallicola TaxID=2904075 RepID=A0ABQ0AE13_9GAMM
MYPDIKFPQTKVDWLIADFSKKNKPTIADFMRLRTIGGLYDSLDNYRTQSANMNAAQLEAEKHNSKRLGRYMTRAGDPKPSKYCDAHAIVSGGHPDAILMRGLMAWLKMRIDDPFNGCWLPRDWEDRSRMPNYLRKAVPHKRIHHNGYYRWLRRFIDFNRITTQDQLIRALRLVRVSLQSGNVPPNVMPRTGR